MAKGDDSRARNQIDAQGGLAQNNLNNQRARTLDQSNTYQNNYTTGVNRQMGDYDNLMNQYQNIMNRPDIQMNQQYKGNIDSAMGGYGNFAQNGGFSPQDIQDIRARSIAPTRAVYANAQREVGRQSALAGGYAPNAIAARAKMAREQGQAVADANTNTNAAIAQMQQQGKLQGLSGMGSLANSQLGLQNNIDMQNLNKMFGGAEGMRSIYGTNPALASMFGNQALASTGQGIDIENLQSRLGLGIMGAQNQAGQLPGKFQSAMGNINAGLGTAGQFGRFFGGLF